MYESVSSNTFRRYDRVLEKTLSDNEVGGYNIGFVVDVNYVIEVNS